MQYWLTDSGALVACALQGWMCLVFSSGWLKCSCDTAPMRQHRCVAREGSAVLCHNPRRLQQTAFSEGIPGRDCTAANQKQDCYCCFVNVLCQMVSLYLASSLQQMAGLHASNSAAGMLILCKLAINTCFRACYCTCPFHCSSRLYLIDCFQSSRKLTLTWESFWPPRAVTQ